MGFLRQVILLSLCSAVIGIASAERTPPNIVLILVDDLGWRDLGCYGRGDVYETPNIDALASEGMRFTQAYSDCPVCSPSRAALLTGKNPARLQFTGHITAIGRHRHPDNSRIIPPDDFMYLRHEEITLAEALKPRGYVSGHFGKWHLGHEGYWPTDQGFDVNAGGWTHGSPPTYWGPYKNPDKEWNAAIPTLKDGEEGEYLTDRLTEEAIAFINQNKSKPFFLYVPYYSVHTPLEAPEALVDKYTKKLDSIGEQIIKPTYAAMVERVDQNVGKILDTLDELGLSENTIVVFFSDNGGYRGATDNRPLRESKSYLYEGGIRVPLILRWPGVIPKNVKEDTPVIGSDLFPTLITMAGGKIPGATELDGVEIQSLWTSGEAPKRDTFYWYYPHYGLSKEPAMAVRKGDFKLIHFYDPPRTELYNLGTDLGETRDLAAEMPEKVKELKEAMRNYLAEVGAKMHTQNPDHTPN